MTEGAFFASYKMVFLRVLRGPVAFLACNLEDGHIVACSIVQFEGQPLLLVFKRLVLVLSLSLIAKPYLLYKELSKYIDDPAKACISITYHLT